MHAEFTREHPDVQGAWSQWSEDQTLHLVLVYNNPFRWESRRTLFNDAVRHFVNTPNVRVYIVELAYDQRPFETAEFSARPDLTCLQLRCDCELWHKENLINVGVRSFPPDWQYGGYFDADFHCTRHDWALEAIHLLQHHQFVQLFSSYADLATSHKPYRLASSFAWNYLNQEEFQRSWEQRRQKSNPTGDGRYGTRLPKTDKFPFGFPPGATGGGWAWRRQAFNTVGGMLDTCILGSGDWHMAFGLAELTNVAAEMKRCTKPYMNAVLQWQNRAARLKEHPGKSAIGCVNQFAAHHFHGSKSQRHYGDRWHILQRHEFDPATDLTRDWQGVWRWAGNKPKLRDEVRGYFLSRNEDDPTLRGGEATLV